MPEGTPLEQTARVTAALAAAALEDPAVVDVQIYVGAAAPYNFNGLVRHYFLRRAPHLGRPAGEPAAQARARRSRATPLPRACADRLAPIAAGTARPSRWPRCRRDRPCCRRWSPSLRARRRATPIDARRAGRRRSSSARRAWSTSTGTSRHRSRKRRARGGRARRPRRGHRAGDDRRARAHGGAGRSAACCTTDARARTCRSSLRLPRDGPATRSAASQSLRLAAAQPVGDRRADARSSAGTVDMSHLPQEPAAGHLRDGRRRGRAPRARSTPSSA